MKDLKKSSGLTSGDYVKSKGYKFLDYTIDPKKLKLNPRNPYKPLDKETYERLKKDIDDRGIIDPLIIDENLTLLTGHNRLTIALELNLPEIPVRKVSNISEQEKFKLMGLDNLLRRQLTPEERKDFIKEFYKEDLEKENRGGNRKSKPSIVGFENKGKKRNLAEEVSKYLGISKRQAERDLSEIKNEGKPKKEKSKPSIVGFEKTPSKKAQIRTLEKEIKELKKVLNEKETELKKLKKEK
ncbi:MAG: ParB N-terminal domain-containing protein [Leptospiraceae bacterium]|nr:ParB N-terminal domain-containing protein [Leptospiraceae bacterium]